MIQRRVDGSVSFDRNWRDYRDGFGDLHSEFWLGNEHIHELSAQGEYSLRIHLEDWSNKHKHALYQRFRWLQTTLRAGAVYSCCDNGPCLCVCSVEDEEHQYRLHVSGFSGTVQDSFSWYHDEQSFSTPDSGNICAEISHSGWWYSQCFYVNLNGFYYRVSVHKQPIQSYLSHHELFHHNFFLTLQGGRYTLKTRGSLGPDGIVWYSWKDSDYYSLRKVSMMIRPRNFRAHMSP